MLISAGLGERLEAPRAWPELDGRLDRLSSSDELESEEDESTRPGMGEPTTAGRKILFGLGNSAYDVTVRLQ